MNDCAIRRIVSEKAAITLQSFEPGKEQPKVKISGLTKRFGKVAAIENVTFEVPGGSFVTLLGPSGSGKTTVLRCIAGVEEPDYGKLEINGRVVFSSEAGVDVPPEKRNVGMVYQSYALWPHMSVFENVAYPLRVRRTPGPEIEKMVLQVLDELEISGVKDRLPSTISGGQQQRVALARALVYNPSVLLLDEPLSNLDDQLRQNVRDDLKLLQKRIGITTIYVTHDKNEALSLSDKIVLLNGGQVDAQGTPLDMLQRPPTSFSAKFVGGMLVLDGLVISLAKNSALVETEQGKIVCDVVSDEEEIRTGIKVKLCVRPGDVSIIKTAPSEAQNILKGIVRGITLDTDRVGARVEIAEQVIVIPITSTNSPPSAGEGVSVVVPASACYLITG